MLDLRNFKTKYIVVCPSDQIQISSPGKTKYIDFVRSMDEINIRPPIRRKYMELDENAWNLRFS